MTTLRILAVEDEELNLTLLRAVLARGPQWLRDAELVAARRLAQARALLGEQAFDLVILDLRLPDGSGLDLAAELNAAGLLPGIAILAVTANALPADRDAARAAGCVGFVAKPYQPAELISAIEAVTSGADARL